MRYMTQQGRELANSFNSFARGVGISFNTLADTHHALRIEFTAEMLCKRNISRVVEQYFKKGTGHNFDHFCYTFVGVNLQPDRNTTLLYSALTSHLFVADWKRPNNTFFAQEFQELAKLYADIAEEAVEQCIKYNARSLAYFKTVAEQFRTNQLAEEQNDEADLQIIRHELYELVDVSLPKYFWGPTLVILWAIFESGISEIATEIKLQKKLELS